MSERTGYDDHFGPEDRRQLIEMNVHLRHLADAVSKMELSTASSYMKLEERVRTLENFRYWTIGVAAVLGALIEFVTHRIIKI